MYVVVSVVLEYHSLNPMISLDNAVDSSISTSTTEEAATSSKINLHAAGREPSAKKQIVNMYLECEEKLLEIS